MADEKLLARGKNVYDTLCAALEKWELKFKRHDEDFAVSLGVIGDDLPVDLVFIVDPDTQVVNLFSKLPFTVPADMRDQMAVALTVANYGLRFGCFEYNIETGDVKYRSVSSYRGSILGEEIYMYMLTMVNQVVDDYNDKLFMLVKGMMTLDQFIDWEKNR